MDPKFLFIGSKCQISCLFMDKRDVYSGDTNGTIIKWDYDSRRPIASKAAHCKSILKIDYLKTIDKTVSQGRDGLIKLWTIKNNIFTEFNRFDTNEYSFCQLIIVPLDSGEREALCHVLGDSEGTVEVLEFPKDVVTHHLTARPSFSESVETYGHIMALSALPHSVILAGYEAGHMVMFQGGTVASRVHVAPSLTCLSVNNQNIIVVGTAENELLILQASLDPPMLTVVNRVALNNPGVSCLSWRRDGRIVASGGWDGLIRLFSGKSFKQLAVLRWDVGSKAKQLCLTFSKDDNCLLSGSDDKVICLWDLYS